MTMRTVLHIGFPKTATSTLQSHFFAPAGPVHYLEQDLGPSQPDSARAAYQASFDVLAKDGLSYDGERVQAAFQTFCGQADPARQTVTVISQERYAAPMAVNWHGDRAVIAGRLKALFPDAQILITLREQVSMLHSQYVNRNAKGALYRPLEEWLDFVFTDPQQGYAHEFCYDAIVRCYRDLFGDDRVTVLLFEDFIRDRAGFTQDLADCLDIPVTAFPDPKTENRDANPSKSARSLGYARFRNAFLPNVPLSRLVPAPVANGVRRYLQGGARAKAEISPDWRARISDYYADSNARLGGMIGAERLREAGYALPELADPKP